MKSALIVYPHHLFEKLPVTQNEAVVYLWEHPLYFTQFAFHKEKLWYHIATMDFYQDYLENIGYQVQRIYSGKESRAKEVFSQFRSLEINNLIVHDFSDYLLEKEFFRFIKSHQFNYQIIETPMFMTSRNDLPSILEIEKGYFLARFYKNQRIKRSILVDAKNNPEGGKWSFDVENRKPLPKEVIIPKPIEYKENQSLRDKAKWRVEKEFSNNPGIIDTSIYPVSFGEVNKQLFDFLERKFYLFGLYEDAIDSKEHWLWHSVLTPALNTGLITPNYIVGVTLDFAQKKPIPFSSLEGFIRQIIGWREFMRAVYLLEGVNIRNANYFNHQRKIPSSFYEGKTGIDPIDQTINKLLKTAYNHHIERLMVLGNFMLLCEFNPTEIYQWFMTFYIDAYDWVMVPNVYSMSQYADGGLITTKPYSSSSAYLLKMGNWEKGDWTTIWDALYWNFIWKNQERFSKNQRMVMMVSLLNKMDKNKIQRHLLIAKQYLESLDK